MEHSFDFITSIPSFNSSEEFLKEQSETIQKAFNSNEQSLEWCQAMTKYNIGLLEKCYAILEETDLDSLNKFEKELLLDNVNNKLQEVITNFYPVSSKFNFMLGEFNSLIKKFEKYK